MIARSFRRASDDFASEPATPRRTAPPDSHVVAALLALSGVAFAVLLLLGWFLSGGNTPDYTATDEDWTTWAEEPVEERHRCVPHPAWRRRVPALRGDHSKRARECGADGSRVRDAGHAAFAGALVGIAGWHRDGHRCGARPVRVPTRIRSPLERWQRRPPAHTWLPRWALPRCSAPPDCRHCEAVPSRVGPESWHYVGAVAFLITFLTLVVGLGEDSVFGYGFLPGILALVIWSIATSIAEYRAVATSARGLGEDRSIEPVSMRAGSGRHLVVSDQPSDLVAALGRVFQGVGHTNAARSTSSATCLPWSEVPQGHGCPAVFRTIFALNPAQRRPRTLETPSVTSSSKRADRVARDAGARSSGRIRRTSSGWDSDAVRLAVIAADRHEDTG